MLNDDIIIENVTASVNINPVDLEELNERLNDAVLNYTLNKENGIETPLSILYTNNDDIGIVLFNDGRLVSIQATTIEDAKNSIIDFVEKYIE